jgi:periplasmic protein TonB
MLLPPTTDMSSLDTEPEMVAEGRASETPILEGVFRTPIVERELWQSMVASTVFHGALLALVMAAAAWWIRPAPQQISERMLDQLRASQARIVLVEQASEPEPPPVVVQLPPEPAPMPERVLERETATQEQQEVAAVEPPSEELLEVAEPAAAMEAQPEEASAAPLAPDDSAPVEVVGPTAADPGAPVEPIAAADPGLMPGSGGRTDGAVDGQPGGTAAAVQPPSAGATDSEGADLGRLAARHRENMNRCFERVARYPSALRRERVEGDVGLAIRLDERGNIVEVRVGRSSGHDALDQWAVEQAEAVGRCTAPPAELGADGLRVLLPVRYRVN